MAFEHQVEDQSRWAAISWIAVTIARAAEMLRKWVRQAERDRRLRTGASGDERERLKALERENFELRHANESLRPAFRNSTCLQDLGYAHRNSRPPRLTIN